MKKTLMVLAALAACTAMVFADDAAPVVKNTGFLSGGLQYFNALGNAPGASAQQEIYAADSAINGFNVPIFILDGVNVTGKTYGYNIDLAFNGTSSATVWDAYSWATFGAVTVEAGQLNEYGFTNWVNWDSYLARAKYGSAGVAVKYGANGFNAIFEVPAYGVPGVQNHTNSWVEGSADGSALAALNSLYVAANYTVPNIVGILAGYHGNGLEADRKTAGGELWIDLDFSALVKNSTILLEYDNYNIGADDVSTVGDNYFAFLFLGYNFGTFSVKSDFEYLVMNDKATPAEDGYDFRIQPVFTYPINSTLSFVLTARIDDVAGKALNGEGTGSPVFWLNPELQVTNGASGIQVGAFVGNDYTGGSYAGGSWFFGNSGQSSPAAPGNGFNASAETFLNAYVTYTYSF